MDHKLKYIGFVMILLIASFLFSGVPVAQKAKAEQHLTYNTEVADFNTSIDAETFSTHLPLVTIHTGGVEIPGKPLAGQSVKEIVDTTIMADIRIIENEGKLNTPNGVAKVNERAQIRVRGHSSREFDKTGYLLEFVDAQGNESAAEVMDMEANSTWILHGPFLDKTLMRNYMWYNLSGQIMEWAPEARFCELFLDGTYQGVYVMAEKISRGDGRIEIKKYDERFQATSYIVRLDREGANNDRYLDNFTEYTSQIQDKMDIQYPGAETLSQELLEYISKDFSEFEKGLYSYDYKSKNFGYHAWIDTDNFIDYFIINEVTQNTDAGVYSTYFYKDTVGKIKMAVWDFNNSSDNYIESPRPVEGFFMHERPWFLMLLKDPEFVERILFRYRQLRQDILSDAFLQSYIEDVEKYLGYAVHRNNQVWGYTFEPERDWLAPGRNIASYSHAIEQYETRLLERMAWLDANIETLQFYCHDSKNKKFNH